MAPTVGRGSRINFSEVKLLNFIHDYASYEVLWDINREDYKDRLVRNLALLELATKYDLTEDEVKNKIRGLRSTYLQEKKKIKESGGAYEPTLHWYHDLDFLADCIVPRTRRHAAIEDNMSNAVCVLNNRGEPSYNKRRRKILLSKKDKEEIINSNNEPEDEFDFYGKSVANQLRALPIIEAVKLQSEIQDLITKRRLAVLGKQQANQAKD